MPHKKRKVRKKRGSRTHGYGRVGQHRGKGQRGGTGKAGRRKHKWSYIIRYEPDYFEDRGFKPPRKNEVNAINVGELDEQVNGLLSEKNAIKKANGIYVDLGKLGYEKLLGGGKVTHPLIAKIPSRSRSAAQKIEEAEGRILVGRGEEAAKQFSTDEEEIIEATAPEAAVTLTEIRGIDPKRAEKLKVAGINSIGDLAKCSPQNLAEKTMVSERTASKWIEQARSLLGE